MNPPIHRVMKIYSKAANGRTVDVQEVLFSIEEPRTINSHLETKVRLSQGRIFVVNGVGNVLYNREAPKGLLRITWDGDIIYQAGSRLY